MLNYKELALLIISVVVAAVSIVIGYVFPSTGTDILKDIMVFGGGAGIAFVFASTSERASTNREAEAARARLRSLCNRSAQTLGIVAQNMYSACALIREAEGGSHESEYVATMLDNAAVQAQVIIGDLEEMAGGKIALDDLLLNTLQALQEPLQALQENTDALPSDSTGQKEKITEDIKRLEQLIRPPDQIQRAHAASRSPVTFSCPNCRNTNTTLLGDLPGSTQHVWCSGCLSRLVCHRSPQGAFFVKVLSTGVRRAPLGPNDGAASPPQSDTIDLKCPGCGAAFPVAIRPGDGPVIVRNCFQCNERLFIDRARRTLLKSEKTSPLQTQYIPYNGKAYLVCPKCMNPIRVAHLEKGTLKTSCSRCTSLIEATSLASEATGDAHPFVHARTELLSGNITEAARLLGITLELSPLRVTGGEALRPRDGLSTDGFQVAKEGLVAFSSGDLNTAKRAFARSRSLGFHPVHAAINDVMAALAEKQHDKARRLIAPMEGVALGPYQKVALAALRSICDIEDDRNADLSELTLALEHCTGFRFARSPLVSLRDYLGAVGDMDARIARVFTLMGSGTDVGERNPALSTSTPQQYRSG